ncbi:virulence factor Mce-like protein [Nocardia transvalensis]|uniref:Virulence factor Mce-like protein n=1 Tax=Nocardia transvalensis TaxID=37333 RepID=A0A7W9PBL3_9NOCA|nr:MlaD family protein [Nocardia transvalensis]MBB5912668.1 virulence factor Mce-like protein [Nocardia transvalensis]
MPLRTMLHTALGSRVTMSVAGALALVAVAVLGYITVADPLRRTESYCALMPDSVGLYAGNHVTMRGVPVGTVTGIHPAGDKVRVDFAVDADHPVLTDASATTLSRNVTTDRDLAVLNSGTVLDRWDPRQCITRTLTPKSLTETLHAVAGLSKQLLGTEPRQDDAIGRLVTQLNSATAGTGPQLNALIGKIGSALDHPDAAIGRLSAIIDSLAALSDSVSTHWGTIDSMVRGLESILHQVNDELFSETTTIIDDFRRVLPMLNDITTMFGDPIFLLLDASVPLIRFLGAHIATLRQIIDMVPVITGAFTAIVDPRTGAPGLTFAPPRVALPTPEGDKICAAVNSVAPGRCSATGDTANVDLVRMILATAGAR